MSTRRRHAMGFLSTALLLLSSLSIPTSVGAFMCSASTRATLIQCFGDVTDGLTTHVLVDGVIRCDDCSFTIGPGLPITIEGINGGAIHRRLTPGLTPPSIPPPWRLPLLYFDDAFESTVKNLILQEIDTCEPTITPGQDPNWLTVQVCATSMVRIQGGYGITFQNVSILDSSFDGIDVLETTNFTLRGSTIARSRMLAVHFYGGASRAINSTIEHNTFVDNDSNVAINGSGVFRNNYLSHNHRKVRFFTCGILLALGSNACPGGQLLLGGWDAPDTHHLLVEGNTIINGFLDHPPVPGMQGIAGIEGNTASNLTIRNNTITQNSGKAIHGNLSQVAAGTVVTQNTVCNAGKPEIVWEGASIFWNEECHSPMGSMSAFVSGLYLAIPATHPRRR